MTRTCNYVLAPETTSAIVAASSPCSESMSQAQDVVDNFPESMHTQTEPRLHIANLSSVRALTTRALAKYSEKYEAKASRDQALQPFLRHGVRAKLRLVTSLHVG